MVKRRWIFFIAFVVIIAALYFAIEILSTRQQSKQVELMENNNLPEREQKVLYFITGKMAGPELEVYTNYLNRKSDDPEIAVGREVLSESQGLLLLYLVHRNQKNNFDISLNWTIENLLLDKKLFSWVKRANHTEQTNALIDDLRIVRALISAYEKWPDKKYLSYINQVSEALLTYNTVGNIPIDFYNFDDELKSNELSIAYLDLYTMKKLRDNINSRWKIPYEKALALIKNSKLAGTGLYQFQYDVQNAKYIEKEEISLIQSVYVMLHLAEVGIYDTEGLDWLWSQYEKYGRIYAVYSNQSHEPISSVESTALYALLGRTYYLAGDRQKAEVFMKACEPYQVLNEKSIIYGSFGNEAKAEVYSFDNLQYLLSSSLLYR